MVFSTRSYEAVAAVQQGPWTLQQAEMRAAVPYGGSVIYGGSQWGAPAGFYGAQIYSQPAPPGGPMMLECQMPPSDTGVTSLIAARFPRSNAWRVCAGVQNTMGYARAWTRNDALRTWEPTTAWVSPAGRNNVEVRSLFAYTDTVTGVDYLFAGVDDKADNGGIFRAAFNPDVPGGLVWDAAPELPLTSTNQGPAPNPDLFTPRVMSFCALTSLYATVGTEIWQRIDGLTPSWTRVWVKPLAPNEASQSGLRGLTKNGNNLLVFPEGTDWSVLQLAPDKNWAVTKLWGISDLSAALGSGFKVGYALGAYNNMQWVQSGSAWYGLIGLSVMCNAYPPGTPIYWGSASGKEAWLAQAPYVVMSGKSFRVKQVAAQTNPTIACRFMVPIGGSVVAGGPDFEMWRMKVELGWVAYDTAANTVA